MSMPYMQVHDAVAAEARSRGLQEGFKSVCVCGICPPPPPSVGNGKLVGCFPPQTGREKEERGRARAAGRDTRFPKPKPCKQERRRVS